MTQETTVADVKVERFLTAYVSQDAKIIGIEHDTDADWHEVQRAHEALRDRLNVLLAEREKCPFFPANLPKPTENAEARPRDHWDADWWKPEPSDPFWMLEAEDGEWLKNRDSLLGTRDATKAIRFPTEETAMAHPARMKPGCKWWSAKATEHLWCDLRKPTEKDELVEALRRIAETHGENAGQSARSIARAALKAVRP